MKNKREVYLELTFMDNIIIGIISLVAAFGFRMPFSETIGGQVQEFLIENGLYKDINNIINKLRPKMKIISVILSSLSIILLLLVDDGISDINVMDVIIITAGLIFLYMFFYSMCLCMTIIHYEMKFYRENVHKGESPEAKAKRIARMKMGYGWPLILTLILSLGIYVFSPNLKLTADFATIGSVILIMCITYFILFFALVILLAIIDMAKKFFKSKDDDKKV